jgi:hypothetical protein
MIGNGGAGDRELLRAEIERTRAELGETVQLLAARADVKERLRASAVRTRQRARQRARTAAVGVRTRVHDAGSMALRNPVPWALVTAGAVAVTVALLMLRGWRR